MEQASDFQLSSSQRHHPLPVVGRLTRSPQQTTSLPADASKATRNAGVECDPRSAAAKLQPEQRAPRFHHTPLTVTTKVFQHFTCTLSHQAQELGPSRRLESADLSSQQTMRFALELDALCRGEGLTERRPDRATRVLRRPDVPAPPDRTPPSPMKRRAQNRIVHWNEADLALGKRLVELRPRSRSATTTAFQPATASMKTLLSVDCHDTGSTSSIRSRQMARQFIIGDVRRSKPMRASRPRRQPWRAQRLGR